MKIIIKRGFLFTAIIFILVSFVITNDKLVDVNIHDTYYVLAYQDFFIILSIIFGFTGLIYFVLEKLKFKFPIVLIFIHLFAWLYGFSNLFYIPMLGINDNVYYTNTIISDNYLFHSLVTTTIGLIIFLVNIFVGFFRRNKY